MSETKEKKTMTPEARARMLANLKKGREMRAKKLAEKKGATKPVESKPEQVESKPEPEIEDAPNEPKDAQPEPKPDDDKEFAV